MELLDGAMQALDRDGYVVFERLIPEETLAEIRADVAPRFLEKTGRNNFEGFATKRSMRSSRRRSSETRSSIIRWCRVCVV